MIRTIQVHHNGTVTETEPNKVPLGLCKVYWNNGATNGVGVIANSTTGRRVFMVHNWRYGEGENNIHVFLENFAKLIEKIVIIDYVEKDNAVIQKPSTLSKFLDQRDVEYRKNPNPYTLGRLSATQEIALL